MALPVALQLYSIRDEMAKDMREALIKVMSMGYDGVEFAGLYGHSASEIKALCAELGLNPISAHVPIDDMVKDPEGVVSTYAEIGCKYIVVPYVIEESTSGRLQVRSDHRGYEDDRRDREEARHDPALSQPRL